MRFPIEGSKAFVSPFDTQDIRWVFRFARPGWLDAGRVVRARLNVAFLNMGTAPTVFEAHKVADAFASLPLTWSIVSNSAFVERGSMSEFLASDATSRVRPDVTNSTLRWKSSSAPIVAIVMKAAGGHGVYALDPGEVPALSLAWISE